MKLPLLSGPRVTQILLLALPIGLIAGGIVAVLFYPSWQPKLPPKGNLISPSLSR